MVWHLNKFAIVSFYSRKFYLGRRCNPMTAKFSPKMPFWTNQLFSCQNAEWGFQFGACALAKIWTTSSEGFFLASYLSFFPAVYTSLPFALHILSGCHKKLGVNYGQSVETNVGPWSTIGIVDRFTTVFAPKLITFFFSECRQYPKSTVVQIELS